jgi:serine protease AprX
MSMPDRSRTPRPRLVWGPLRAVPGVLACALIALATPAAAQPGLSIASPGGPSSAVKNYKLDDIVDSRSNGNPQQTSSVIVTLVPGADLPPQFSRFARGGKLDIINGVVLDLPNGLLKQLGADPNVFRIHDDRPIFSHNYRTSVTVGARAVQDLLGYTGAGVGIAVIDSGVTNWHDDLSNVNGGNYPYGNQRVTKFVDFVNGRTQPYDDNGHGSHVAGTILGNGSDSSGEKAGIAPNASLVSLKVLDKDGLGTISNFIRALNWVAANAKAYNIKVVNVSVGAAIRESCWTDPLTLAAKAIADKGVTVVAAAGNLGQNADGELQWGGVTAPGNAPWVLTVGASSTMGTLTRGDDEMAAFSSSGPTWIDFLAKPDLVAPGVGTVSLAALGSEFYTSQAKFLVQGTPALGFMPYLSLTGTSMAAPVVSGTVALMLEANPKLTPNLIKAILQYTAEADPNYSPLREGAGFLNSLGAVRLAKFYADGEVGSKMPVQDIWSQQIFWGNHLITGGYINPNANAWANNIVWGTATTRLSGGDNIVWGTNCARGDCDNIVWGTRDAKGDNIVWGTGCGRGGCDNIVWGTARGDGDNIVWGTKGGDNIVWGTSCGRGDCDNIVWGTARGDGDNIVWGTAAKGDNIVWGTAGGDNIVWGTARGGGDNIVWGTGRGGGDNIVWGTARGGGDNIVWGTNAAQPVLFPDTANEPLPSLQLEFGDIVPLPSASRGGR